MKDNGQFEQHISPTHSDRQRATRHIRWPTTKTTRHDTRTTQREHQQQHHHDDDKNQKGEQQEQQQHSADGFGTDQLGARRSDQQTEDSWSSNSVSVSVCVCMCACVETNDDSSNSSNSNTQTFTISIHSAPTLRNHHQDRAPSAKRRRRAQGQSQRRQGVAGLINSNRNRSIPTGVTPGRDRLGKRGGIRREGTREREGERLIPILCVCVHVS